jgi:photosystem II stability/assembly factor-like uncharacterized protein
MSVANSPWTAPVQVGPAYPEGDGTVLYHVHVFTADGLNGVVYGAGEAFVTHDGGRTWQNVHLLGAVMTIGGQGTAWLVTYYNTCDYLGICAAVQISHDGGRSWSPTSRLPTHCSGCPPKPAFVPVDVVAFEKGGLLMSASTGDMVLTEDGGLTWTRLNGNCGADTVATRVATSDGVQIWETCTGPKPAAVLSTHPWSSVVFASNDNGKSWTPHGLVPAGTFQELWSSRHDHLVVASNFGGLVVTNDGGRTWTQVQTDPRYGTPVSIGYLADGSAWAVYSRGTIWATADGGQTWKELTISASKA